MTKAQKLGVVLSEHGQFVKATWPARNMHIFGVDARWAIEQVEAAQRLIHYAEERDAALSLVPSIAQPTLVHLVLDGETSPIAQAPIMWWTNREKIDFDLTIREPKPQPEAPLMPTERAEPNEEAEEAAKPPASVVKQKYRAIYTEAGHPTTCGDELAEKLNNLCRNSKGTSMERFDAIMVANDIDMGKYSRTSPGWQGRYRMTGRNMLAKKVHANGGVLKLPESWPEGSFTMSAEWMSSQRFK